MARELNTIGVVGLGTMGAGIAEVFARNGFQVVAVEVDDAALARGRGHVEQSTGRALARGKLTEQDRDDLLARVRFASTWPDLAACDLVIEAVPERLDIKHDILRRLDAVVRPDAILATNTSSLSVTEIAVATDRPHRVIGMHFFNPAPVLKLVEVIRTVVTADDVVDDVRALATKLGKTPVVIGDRAGFIANALLFGYLNRAVSLYESRVASREDIDLAMRLGAGLPMGPLTLLDLIGLDTGYQVLVTMYRQSRDRLHAPSPLLQQMVTAGLTGRKSGRGFYTYAEPHSGTVVDDDLTPRSVGAGADAQAGPGAGPARPVRAVGVVGSGVMASEVAGLFAAGGYDVTVVARSPEQGSVVAQAISTVLEQADRAAAGDRIRTTTELSDLASADLVLEAITEDLPAKRALFAELDAICRPGAVLATSTSALPVVACAAATRRPADMVGMHFFHRAATAPLVEVVRTITTADDVVATAEQVCRTLGKRTITCPDRAGFVVNALLFPYLNDAVRMLQANYATAGDIDTAMRNGCGYPKGPLELLDEIGLDVALAMQRRLYEESREPGLAPAALLEHLVMAGHLGDSTGRGVRTATQASADDAAS